ncbi:hypothetical protein DRQ33_08355, partial [bacterium]
LSDDIKLYFQKIGIMTLGIIPIPSFDKHKKNYGTLLVTIDREYFWSEEEKGLLIEVVEDLGFALNSIKLEQEKETILNKLAQSEELYRSLVNLAPIGIGLHDGKKLLFANDKAVEILGYDNFQQMSEKSLLDFVSTESVEMAKSRIERMFSADEPASPMEEILVRKDGTKIIAEVSAAPIEIDGEKRVLIVVHDITKRKKAEEEALALEQKLLQAQKLEAIGRLAGGIAHEFNNLLNGIIGYAELLKENLSASSSAFRYTELILKAGLDAAKLTRQILSFARRTPKEETPFLINEAIQEVVDILKQTAPRNVDIVMDLADEEIVIVGDMAQIEQVIMNLCVNAFDAMPQGGKLNIQTEIAQIKDDSHFEIPPGKYTRIKVSDTGIGMSEEILQNIFDPFFTTKEPREGTGLGLSIVYSIVHEHKGHIYANSTPGEGSTFEILLPISDSEAKTGPKFAAQSKVKGSETILVADDEPVMLNLMVDLLQSRGYRVLTAVDGVEAVELFKSRQDEIDLVILDVIMPNMDGLKALNQILEIEPYAKILVVSGYAQIDTVDKCLEAGAKGFIHKPLRIAELSEKIWNTLKE